MAKIKSAPSSAGKPSRMPKAGVQYPKGQDKTVLADRSRRAFGKVKARQSA